MEFLVKFFLRRPVLVTAIVVAVILIGLKILINIPKEGFPNVSMNQVNITTIYPGASARDVEFNVTSLIEDELQDVGGIKEFFSTSKEGMSIITVTADEDVNDEEFNQIYDDIDTAVSQVTDLPPDIDGKPTLDKVTSADIPVIEIALSGSHKDLLDFIPHLERKIKTINTVASTEVIGLPDEEIHISIDPSKAMAKQVDLPMIAGSIQQRNTEGTGGTLESFIGEKKIVSLNKYENDEQILDTNIRTSSEGLGVKLKDIGIVYREPEDMKLTVRNNGYRGASILVKKKNHTDIIKTVTAIKEIIDGTQIPKSVKIKLLNDQSVIAYSRLSLVVDNAIIGGALVCLILFVVFNAKTAFWTAFGIPFSLFATYSVFPLLGLSLDVLSLGGFIVVLGMVVDDAIVISEQVNTYKEKGYGAFDAAHKAVVEIWKPVMASSITTIIAFTPLLSLGGLPGKFVWVIPLIVILVLTFSLFDAYFLLPAHLMHGKAQKKPEKKKFIIAIEEFYRRTITKLLHHRYKVLIPFLAAFIATGAFTKNVMKKEPFPQEAAESFYIQLTAPIGISLENAEKQVSIVEKIISQLPEEELVGYSSRVGTHSSQQATDRGTQNNLATIFVYLPPYAERDRTAFKIMDEIREKVAAVTVIEDVPVTKAAEEAENQLTQKYDLATTLYNTKTVIELIRIGPPLGHSYEVLVTADSDELRQVKATQVRKFLEGIDGVVDIQDDEIVGKEEFNIKIDYDRLARVGVTVADIVTTLRIAFEGQIITDLTNLQGTTDIRLRLNRQARSDLHFLSNLPVLNNKGQLIRINKLVKIETQPSKGEIKRFNGRRTTTVFGNVNKKIISPQDLINKVDEKFKSDANVEISFEGEAVEAHKIFKNLGSAAIVAVFGVYLVVSLIFNSFTTPFVVMLCLPFMIIGVMWPLFFHGYDISLFTGLAMVGLMGVIVNDAIVMVFTILEAKKDNDADVELMANGATERLRPILLTTVTTVAALLPTAYGLGGYDPFLSQMSLALGYGLIFSTLIVLILVPCFFLIGQDIRNTLKRKFAGSKIKQADSL